jgi:dTDP-glucose 4,6-dehydratase
MTALVTGGAGFIGSALARALVGHDVPVIVFDLLTYAGSLENLQEIEPSRYQFVKADICDGTALRDVLRTTRPSVVFHLAAESHVDRSIDGAEPFLRTNVTGTAVLLDAVLDYWRTLRGAEGKQFRLIHVSTDEVFGELGPHGIFTTKSPYRPNSPYAATKAASDHLVQAWHRTYGLPVIVSHCSNNYGPRQLPEKLIPVAILNALEGRPIPLYGQGENIRDWIQVDDHASALQGIAARGQPGQRYLVGARQERRNIDVVQDICRILDARLPSSAPHARLIKFVADRPGHDFRYAVDPARVEADIGWHATTAFEDGIATTVDWYLENRSWCLRAAERSGRERRGLGAP